MSDSQLQSIKKGQFELEVLDTKPRNAGLVILAITLGLFGTWSAVAPLDSAALAPGSVVIDGYRKTVQHLEGGIVASLEVSDGDSVTKGDVLLKLDDTLAKSELGITKGQILALMATKARLIAERDLKSEIDFTDIPEKSDVRAVEAIANESAVFKARAATNQGQISVLKQRVAQLDEQINGFENSIKSKLKLSTSYEDETKELRSLLEDGYVDIQRIRELERRNEELKSNIDDIRSSIAQTKVRKSETELQIAQLDKELRTEVVNQLTQLEIKLSDLNERESALESRLKRTVITAPESGMVMAMAAHTLGGVIRSGEPILDIVPQGTELVIEARVSPIDIDRVNIGMTAEVKFSAFKQAITPKIDGIITRLSGDRLVDQATGMPYYLAKIKLPKDQIQKLDPLKLIPGMPAEVLIKTGERTLLEYLIQPATDAVARSMIED